MSAAGRVARGAGIAVAATAAVAGALYGAERFAAARVRRRDDGDGELALHTPLVATRTIPSHDGGTIAVFDYGTGPPIVLSHGVTLSARTWVLQVDPFVAAGFRVVAFDHRGHGGSLLGSAGHAVENLGDDLLTLCETLDLRDAVLVGHSMGGVAVQSFLARHREIARDRVRGIVLLSTLPNAPGGSQAAQLNQLIERVSRRTPDTTRLWAAPNLGLLLARFGFGKDPKPSHVELVRRMMLECPADTRTAAPRSLIGFDLTPDLAKIELPTLVICGSADVITPPFHSRRMGREIPGARLEMFDGGGHMLMLERTAELNAIILDFARTVVTTTP